MESNTSRVKNVLRYSKKKIVGQKNNLSFLENISCQI